MEKKNTVYKDNVDERLAIYIFIKLLFVCQKEK